MDDLFDFDFDAADLELLDFDFPLEGDNVTVNSNETSEGLKLLTRFKERHMFHSLTFIHGSGSEKTRSRKAAVKSTSKKTGMKLSKNSVVLEAARQSPTNVLVAFPMFDKCDSLVYFPHSYVRHLNRGDVASTARLIHARAEKDCQVNCLCGNETFPCTLPNMKLLLEINDNLEPDRIMCVHSTKVVENQIRSVVFLKFTDSQALYSAVCNKAENPIWRQFAKRANRFRMFASQNGLAEDVKQAILQHAETEDDVLIYMRMELVLTVNDNTKKITSIDSNCQLTSLHPVTPVSNRTLDIA